MKTYMNVYELNRDQLVQLKEELLMQTLKDCSYGELCAADSLISDETIYEEHEGTVFVPEDFWN